jgi:proteasome lid subunit RPN8/RPN11
MTGRILHLTDGLLAMIYLSANRAYPNECCGLIEGAKMQDGWRALAVHEAANLSPEPNRRFLIDPQVQFDLMRKLRGSERDVIGCFHSHPGGHAELSATDRAEAYESDFLYLIVGGSPDTGYGTAAFAIGEGNEFAPVEIWVEWQNGKGVRIS